MNPNICTICERSFTLVQRQRRISIDATILFADIRGFTHLSETMDASTLGAIVSSFQDRCAEAIWAHEGIVNKQMGDGLMAIFNFPIRNKSHAAAAVLAAVEVQRNCASALEQLAERETAMAVEALGVGVGVHTGQVEIGEFSSFRSDFTAIGGAVNLTARLESQAAAGEILVSRQTAEAAGDLVASAAERTVTLKGLEHPVGVRVLTLN